MRVVGDERYVRAVTQALARTESRENGSSLIGAARASPNIVTIMQGPNGTTPLVNADAQNGVGTGATVRWDPNDRSGNWNTDGNNDREPFIGLVHEFGHVMQMLTGTENADPSVAERNAIMIENSVREEHGMPLAVPVEDVALPTRKDEKFE